MTTATDGNFNISPYYDDFDDTKNFLKILFQPGRAVQARELTQIQSILQSQLGKAADHFLADGTPVIGGDVRINNTKQYITLSAYDLVETGYNITSLKGRAILGASSGATALVEEYHPDPVNSNIIYITLNTTDFVNGETINTTDDDTPAGKPPLSAAINLNDAVGNFATFGYVDAGIYYIDGNFVPVYSQKIIVDPFFTDPTESIGFDVQQLIVTSNDDDSMLDPAHGFFNASAPGADRYKVSLVLITETDHTTAASGTEFINLLYMRNGIVERKVSRTDNAILQDTLARRTFDESGNYTVRQFEASILEASPFDSSDDDATFVVKIDPGKAYVYGFEQETIAPIYVFADKTREFERKNNASLIKTLGPYFTLLDDANKYWNFDVNNNEEIELMSDLDGAGSVIGESRIKSLDFSDRIMMIHKFTDQQALTRSVKSVRSKLNTNTVYANITQSNNNGVISGTAGSNDTLIYETADYALKAVVPDETHFTTTKAFNSITRVGDTFTVSSGSNYKGLTSIDFIIDKTTNSTVLAVADYSVAGLGTDTIIITVPNAHAVQQIDVYTVMAVSQMNAKSKTLTSSTDTPLTAIDGNVPYPQILLSNVDAVAITSIIGLDGLVYTSDFVLNTGQKDHIYDYGYVTYTGSTWVNQTYTVTYDYYVHGSTGAYFSVDSYPTYESILDYNKELSGDKVSLRDSLDFRPAINRLSSGDTMIPQSDSILYVDYDYYIPRIDKVYIDSAGTFGVNKGVADLNPYTPNDIEGVMSVYELYIPAYIFNVSEITTKYIENKRYTMRDIGRLEKRIDNLEYYTSLSILESDAIDIEIKDANGLNRFKNGIITDKFTGHGVGDTDNPDYWVAVDPKNQEARLPFTQNFISMEPAPTSIVGSEEDNNVKYHPNIVTLYYEETGLISQPLASNITNITPYEIFYYDGNIILSPDSDQWVDTDTAPDLLVNFAGNSDNWKQPSGWSTEWGSWETRITGTSTTTQNIEGIGGNGDGGPLSIRTNTTTSRESTRSGISSRTVPETITREMGDRVTDVSFSAFMRSIAISYTATGLKPNTTFISKFDDVDVSTHSTGLLSDSAGEVTGVFTVPAATFKTGRRTFTLIDRDSSPTTSASRDFEANGLIQNKERTVASVTFLTQETRIVEETRQEANQTTSVTRATGGGSPQPQPEISAAMMGGGSGLCGGAAGYTASTGGNTGSPTLPGITSTWTAPSDGIVTVTVSGNSMARPSLGCHFDGCSTCGPIGNTFYCGSDTSTFTPSGGSSAFTNGGALSATGGRYIKNNCNGSQTGEVTRTDTMDTRTYTVQAGDTATVFIAPSASEVTQQGGVSYCYGSPSLGISPDNFNGSPTVCIRYQNPPAPPTNSGDPLAQSFFVSGMEGGTYVTSIDVKFKTIATDNRHCWLRIQEMVNGFPGTIILPYSEVSMTPTQIVTQQEMENVPLTVADFHAMTATGPGPTTTFTFSNPVYLQNNTEYCFVLGSGNNEYEVFTAKLGERSIDATGTKGARISKPPYIGSMFKSQNQSTWTAEQEYDITFNINRAKFSQQEGTVNLFNESFIGTKDVTTIMPTAELLEMNNTSLNWEIEFKEGSNELGTDWMSIDNYSNKNFDNVVTLDGTNAAPSAAQPIWMKAKIKSTSDNVSPMINLNRVGVVAVSNVGTTGYRCTLGGNALPEIGTKVECDALAGTWSIESPSIHLGAYYTKRVTLDNPAEDLKVYATINLEQGTDVTGYYTTGSAIKRRITIDTSAYLANTWEKSYIYFYNSFPAAGTAPGTKAYATRSRDAGVSNEERLYLQNIDDTPQIKFGGYISMVDLTSSVAWDVVDTYIKGDIVKTAANTFYVCIVDATAGIEPGVSTVPPWSDHWTLIQLTQIKSNSITSDIGSQQAGVDSGLDEESPIDYLPMIKEVSTTKVKSLGQSSTTNTAGWQEYEFAPLDPVEDPYEIFAIKLVFTTQNLAFTPKIRDFRAIAVS